MCRHSAEAALNPTPTAPRPPLLQSAVRAALDSPLVRRPSGGRRRMTCSTAWSRRRRPLRCARFSVFIWLVSTDPFVRAQNLKCVFSSLVFLGSPSLHLCLCISCTMSMYGSEELALVIRSAGVICFKENRPKNPPKRR